MHISIEHSTSGKTFGIAIAKKEGEKPFMVVKSCRIVSGKDGDFVSGPAAKMDDGKWLNYLFTDKGFSDYIVGLVGKPASKKEQPKDEEDLPF